ncbi:diguanylate cyclase [Halomonas sp. YLGW01]|uniref:GGDEF domain-containing protein n=1 Tax=Halomonas sp. YLGW01 TaxID=2773308 RepID=UPI00177C4CAD|nr:diguanylate cyclase [Halomonas sp. YLGW01]
MEQAVPDISHELTRLQARHRGVALTGSMIGLACFLPADVMLVPQHWPWLPGARLLLVAVLGICLWWQQGRPARSRAALLIGLLAAEGFFLSSAVLIEDGNVLIMSHLGLAIAFCLLPLLHWRWPGVLFFNLISLVAYGAALAVWSPFGWQELLAFGGVLPFIGLLLSLLLCWVHTVNGQRSAWLMSELSLRHSEAKMAFERLAEQQKELRQLANFDVMTGLANRQRGIGVLKGALANALQAWQPVSVLLVDVDRLKVINDTYGHAMGDQLICSVATALAESVGPQDVACRLGGDEFLVVLPQTKQAEAEAWKVAFQQRLDACRLEGCPDSRITASVGIARYEPWREGPIDVDDLIRRADGAMYAHKRQVRRA